MRMGHEPIKIHREEPPDNQKYWYPGHHWICSKYGLPLLVIPTIYIIYIYISDICVYMC